MEVFPEDMHKRAVERFRGKETYEELKNDVRTMIARDLMRSGECNIFLRYIRFGEPKRYQAIFEITDELLLTKKWKVIIHDLNEGWSETGTYPLALIKAYFEQIEIIPIF